MMGQLDPSHVERRRFRRRPRRRRRRTRTPPRIHEPPDQPCARRPIDVYPGTGRPPHGPPRRRQPLDRGRATSRSAAGSSPAADPLQLPPQPRHHPPTHHLRLSLARLRVADHRLVVGRDHPSHPLAMARSWAAEPRRPNHTQPSPPASTTSSANHSSCSGVAHQPATPPTRPGSAPPPADGAFATPSPEAPTARGAAGRPTTPTQPARPHRHPNCETTVTQVITLRPDRDAMSRLAPPRTHDATASRVPSKVRRTACRSKRSPCGLDRRAGA